MSVNLADKIDLRLGLSPVSGIAGRSEGALDTPFAEPVR